MDNYRLLVEKLDQFIRKYYINKLIRGSLYSVGLILVLFLTVSVLEYFFYFSSGMRKLMFFSFLGGSLLALGRWVVLPLLNYFHLGKIISHEQAAAIIGSHFADVKDKLLNILQLRNQADSVEYKDLILASINQKSDEIKLVPFKSAINLSQNRKYLRYALPPLLLLLVLLFAAPSVIRDSTFRLINNGTEFLKPAPFKFVIDEEKLSVIQFGDFPLKVEIEGTQLPNEVFIDVEGVQYRLTKEAPNLFSYQFSNVQKDLDFQLTAGLVASEEFTLEVLKKPNILGFDVKLDYPAYVGRNDEQLSSVGDLVVPAGTRIDWIFNAENTDNIRIQFAGGKLEDIKRFSDDLFTFKKQALKDEPYKVFISNQLVPQGDSISYSITVIPDLYPNITAEKFQDSTDNKVLYFVGDASDDYGLLSLSFNYRIKKANGQQGPQQTLKLGKPAGKQMRFDHIFDLRELGLAPGDEVTYYFEIFDNDGVNGSKSARTNMMVYATPTVEEYRAMAEKNNEQVKDDLKKALEESRRLQEELKKAREKLLQEKDLDWQNRKELEKLLQRQKELEKRIEEAKKAFEENQKNQQEFAQPNEETLEKQEQLQKMFDEVMSEEMKELMKQIEDLLQKLEKDDALQMMENSQINNKDMEKQLDRLLELFKQLEVEQKMQEVMEDLQKLAEEEEKLNEETKKADEQKAQDQKSEEQKKGDEQKSKDEKANDKKSDEQKSGEQQNKDQQQQSNEQKKQEKSGEQNQQDKPKQEQLQEKQEQINEKFEDLQEKMEELEKKNEELEKPKELGDNDQEMQDIQKDLNNSQQQLQQKQNQKASQSQKKAAEKMKNMANNMQMQQQQGEMQQMQEDMQALRQMLENLVGLSFDQEDLIKEFDKASINTPRYVELVQQQFKVKDDFRIVEDSLQALSKRLFQIESFITEKVSEINGNMRQSIDHLEERQKPQAADNQQRTMKNLNDLALMLSEMMNQMQQQMASMMSGSQMCNNPSQGQQGGVPKDKISDGQQQMNQDMQKMKERLEKARQQGQGKEGGTAKEFAEMAAKQAALRKRLRDEQKKLQERGQGSKELQDLMDQMDKTETELVNKRLTNETLRRQQDILTRLLEHEKAERERGFEEKRKAETAKEKERKMPPSLEEYIKKREAEIELYKTVSPTLKPYYKNLVEGYFKTLKSK